jgi:hypothetical protein
MINRHYIRVFLGLCLSLILWGVSAQAQQKVPTTAITTVKPVTASKAKPVTASTTKPVTAITAKPVIGFPANVPNPLTVGVALIVNNISKINESAGTFTADIDLLLRWKDPEAFGVKTVGIEQQQFNGEAATSKLETLWTPQVKITNLAEKPLRQEDGLFLYADDRVVYNQRLTATFQNKLELASFPFDTQALPIRLTSSSYSINKVIFGQDQSDIDFSGLSQGLQLSGWTPGNIEFVSSSFRGWDGSFYPQIEAQIMVKRNSASHIPGLLIPYSLILLLPTIVSLWVTTTELEERVSSWAGSILTLLALSFTLAIRYPILGPENIFYQIIWTGFGFQFLMLVITATVMNPGLESIFKDKYIIAELTNFLRWSLPLGLVIFLSRMVLLSIV